MNAINTNAKPCFTPTPAQVRAAELLFTAKAHLALIEPIVLAYQRRILAENRWPRAAAYHSILGDSEPVLEPKEAWTLNDHAHARYAALCADAARQANLACRPGCCPLLEAEETHRQAQHLLAKEMDGFAGLHLDSLVMLPLEKFNEVIDLFLKLLAPHVRDAHQVLDSLGVRPPAPAQGAAA